MREITPEQITAAVASLAQRANCQLPPDVEAALRRAREAESSPLASDVLDQLLENAAVARSDGLPLCQDCGIAVVFAEVGRDVHLTGDLYQAVDAGVRQGYREGFLRASVVRNPLQRDTNTGDNTPAVVHVSLVDGDRLKLTFAPKGGGSENMSTLWMLVPTEGEEGIVRRVVERIKEAGGKPCPPLILGLGIGGTVEQAALLAKRALLRQVGTPNPDPAYAALEARLLSAVNATGVGPMGLGGTTTALAVHIETHPCHIASLPVMLNVQCHAARHASVVL